MRVVLNTLPSHWEKFFLLILLDYPIYWLHKMLVLPQNPWSLPSLKLVSSIDSSIRTMISIPIRNGIILAARQIYLQSAAGSRYDKSEYGIVYAELRRIEYIVSGIQRYAASCIKVSPLLFLYLIELYKNSKTLLYIFVIINILSSIPARFWIRIRARAYQADNELNSEIYSVFSNFGRRLPQTGLVQKLSQEIKLYIIALNTKYKYKVILTILNISLIVCYSFFFNLSVKLFSNFVFLTINYVKIFISIISILSLIEGLPVISYDTQPQIENRAIEIHNLNIPGIFQDLNLKITAGEKVVLTGENGSGKTLILRLLGGYEPLYYKPQLTSTLLEETSTPLLDDFLYLKKNVTWQSEFQEFHFLLEKSTLTRGQKLFLVIASTLLNNNITVLIDEGIDPITGTLLEGIRKLIKLSTATVIVTSHNLNVIQMFTRKLRIVNQRIEG